MYLSEPDERAQFNKRSRIQGGVMPNFSDQNDETNVYYLWTCLEKAVGRRDFDATLYWISQMVIHRSRNYVQTDEIAVIE